MRYAIELARRGLGRMDARPSVGCVLVKKDTVIAAANGGDNGFPHAEQAALKAAGLLAKGATAYVTLEPCAHIGRTPACSQELIKAGIKKVFIACEDIFHKVNGKGIEDLKNAGIEVDCGLLKEEALKINAPFFTILEKKRPFITLKQAVDSHGKIAAGTKDSSKQIQITSLQAQKRAHIERAQHEAILIGVNTALIDNPDLTARIKGHTHNILRVILDTNLKMADQQDMLHSAKEKKAPILIFHDCDEKSVKERFKGDLPEYVECIRHKPQDLLGVCEVLVEKGITRLLVEGGHHIHQAFLKAELVDRIIHFTGHTNTEISGDDALEGFGEGDIEEFSRKMGLNLYKKESLGEDFLEIYEK